MTVGFGDVRAWRAAPLGTAGDGVKRDADDLEGCREQLATQGLPGSWVGVARIVAQARHVGMLGDMDTLLEARREVQRALYLAESEVTRIEQSVAAVEEAAASARCALGDDGSVTDLMGPQTFPNRFEAEEFSRARAAAMQRLAADVQAILVQAAGVDAALARSIPRGYVDDIDEYGQESPEVASRWAELTDAERRAVVEQMIRELAEEYGLDMPVIDWRDESWGSNGQYADGDPGTVSLNEGLLDDPRLIHTVAHELRHGRQFEAIDDADDWHWPWQEDPLQEHLDDGITEEQVEEWEENFDDYQSTASGDTYEEYFEQPVEVDARGTGREYLDGLTAAEIDRLLEASR